MQVFPARQPETGLLLPDELVTAVTGGRFGLECSDGRLVRGEDLVEGPGRVEQDNELELRITIEAVSGPGFCDVFDGAAPRYGELTPTEDFWSFSCTDNDGHSWTAERRSAVARTRESPI